MRRTVLVGFLIALVHAAYGQGPNIICPGGQSTCPSGNTCCRLPSGKWGCCPLPSAVCCSDGTHCCPHGYTCDVSAGTCSHGMLTLPWTEKNVAKPVEVEVVVCPGGGSQCPDSNTCCKLASGEWGCCPFPKAVCCSDGVHCCQEGYTCDVSAGTCSQGMLTLPWAEKNVAQPLKVEAVVCPGGGSTCPSGNTCCKLASGEWGCCPLPSAVCCSDHTHCCPHGYTCDVSAGSCSQGMLTLPWTEKNVAKPIEVEAVVCPGGGSRCPSGNTCCKLASGEWGCCPLPSAVCCSDHTHCCPHGYTCDVSAGSCSQGMLTLPWTEKNVAKPVEDGETNNVTLCPGGRYMCKANYTCCMSKKPGVYGCCHLTKAVCCDDQVHCCPSGHACDLKNHKCNKNSESVPWEERTDAEELTTKIVRDPNIICPGGAAQCPTGSTCCKLASGQWGCCPIPQAVCCNDHVHCCPNGYTCDVSQGTCSRGIMVLPWFEKTVATSLSINNSPSLIIVCPGGRYQCPTGTTCCKLNTGAYSCCPYPQAVCCADHIHCCPYGWSCELSTATCHLGGLSLPWESSKEAMSPSYPVIPEPNNICPGGAAQCPTGNTCCKLASGQWGCCPLPQAVCCNDHVHCCPNGYTCDVSQGTCSQGETILTWFEKTEANPLVPEPNIVCPGGAAQCPTGNTCCKLASGQWGCCPIPRAVCCSDHVHCCPNGYTCNVAQGTCSHGNTVLPWSEKTDAIFNNVEGIVCPNSTAVCKKNETCCKLKSGEWGCCPGVETVCCKDGIHCCPQNTNCGAKNTCVTTFGGSSPMLTKTEAKEMAPKAKPVPWMTKTLALPRWSKVGDVQCDATHYCPSGSTCCRLASGQWGCCPVPNAVCCSDHQHCCPSGYTCQTGTGECVRKM